MIEGYIDYVDEGRVVGWAYDSAQPGLRLLVEVVAGRASRTVVADVERTDLQEAGKGDGRHGFVLTLGADGSAAQEVRARVVPDGQALHGSPYRTDLVGQIGCRAGLRYLRAEAQRARIALGLPLDAAARTGSDVMAPRESAPRQTFREAIRANVIGYGTGMRRS